MTFYRWLVSFYENVIRLSYVYADMESIQNILAGKIISLWSLATAATPSLARECAFTL
jgi:hypothetical protein